MPIRRPDHGCHGYSSSRNSVLWAFSSLVVQRGSPAQGRGCVQKTEFLPLRNRGLGPLPVPVLPIALARRAAATACAAVQSTASLFRCWRPAGSPAPGPGSALTGCLTLHGLLVFLLRVRRASPPASPL